MASVPQLKKELASMPVEVRPECPRAGRSFFLSGVAEELGWSGYALEPLQARWGALRAALIIGHGVGGLAPDRPNSGTGPATSWSGPRARSLTICASSTEGPSSSGSVQVHEIWIPARGSGARGYRPGRPDDCTSLRRYGLT